MTPNDIIAFVGVLSVIPLDWATTIYNDFYLLNCDVRSFAETPIFTVPLFFFIGWTPPILLFYAIVGLAGFATVENIYLKIQSNFVKKLIWYAFLAFAVVVSFTFLAIWDQALRDWTGIHSCGQFRG